jgi:hypothetical protein
MADPSTPAANGMQTLEPAKREPAIAFGFLIGSMWVH